MGFIFLLLNFLSMPRANKSKSHLHNKNIINFKSISTAHYFCSRFGQNIKFNNIKHVPTTVDNVSFLYNKFWSHTSAKLTMRHHTTRHQTMSTGSFYMDKRTDFKQRHVLGAVLCVRVKFGTFKSLS